jgi:hypothetical protein
MAHDHERLREDAAGIGPEPGRESRLHRLSESHHYRIASGEPDIRGWEVRNISGSHLGEVEDLLIDPHRGEVVMLDVDLDDSADHINLPIRGVQLDSSRRCVIVDSGDIRDAQAAGVMGADSDRDRDRELERADVRGRDVRDRDEVDRDTTPRDIRYGASRDLDTDSRDRSVGAGDVIEETVVERRPIVEEVVVRRKVVDENE